MVLSPDPGGIAAVVCTLPTQNSYQPAAPNMDTRATDVPVCAYKTTVLSARRVALQHRNMAASKHRCKIPKMVPAVRVTYWYKKAKKHRTRVE